MMRYLEPKFTVGPPAKSTACERCVWGRGCHAEWCIVTLTDEEKRYYRALFPFVLTMGGNYRQGPK